MNKNFGDLKKGSLGKNMALGLATMVLVGGFFVTAAIPTSAIAPIGSVTMFTDNFDQSGSDLGANGWDNVSGESGGDRRTTSGDGFTVGASSKGLLLEGDSGSNPDETAEYEFSTHGYSSLNISYSRAISGFEPGDSFVAQYSLDDGSFVTLETLTTNQSHADIDFNIDNSSRNTKLTMRFMVNGSNGNDEAGIDNFILSGEGDPLFYDGFEGNDFNAGSYDSWTQEETPSITTSLSWTANNTANNGHSANINGSTNGNPDDAIYRTVDTTGYEDIMLRFAREVENMETGENLKTYISTVAGSPVWSEINSAENVNFASVVFSLPASADNNPDLKIRFEMNADSSGDNSYIDDVVIWGDTFVPTTGSLTVIKNTIGGDGTFAFTGNTGVTSLTTASGTASQTVSLAPGSGYNIAETVPSGWDLSTSSCDNGSTPNSITIVANQTTTCTFTNTKKGHIIIDKVTAPSADGQNFSFTTSGTGYSTFSLTDAEAPNDQEVTPGIYTVTEDSQEGWLFTGLVCTDGTSDTTIDTEARQATINVAAGETVTCTYTNTKLASITVVKNVVAPDGVTDVSDDTEFTVTLGDTAKVISEEGDAMYGNLTPDQQYTIVETQNENYDTITYGGDCAADGTITVTPGQEATCTITNKQKMGKLIVNKIVNHPNGGTATADQFSFYLNGNSGQTYSFIANEGDSMTGSLELDVNPGTYVVAENTPEGSYAITYSGNCVNGVVASNGTLTCTITNSDIPDGKGSITIIKDLPNDNGGTFTVEDFPLWVTQAESEEDPVSMTSGVFSFFDPGTYDISETNPGELTGFTQTISCTDGETTVGNGNITISNQQSWVCTITNDDQPGHLIVHKITSNSDAVTQFDITASGGTIVSPESATQPIVGGGTVDYTVNAGTFSVSESELANWDISSNTCGDVTIANGETKECTITNTRQTGTLRVIKLVEGGEAISSDFQIHVKQGESEVSGSPQAGDSEGTDYILPTGSYTVSETGGPSGYAASFGESCAEGSVTISNEGTTTCTITNTFGIGTLVVKKIVVNNNSGAKIANEFSFAVNGGDSTAFTQDGENTLLGQNTISVVPGTYTVTEPASEGYTASFDACSEISIEAGQTKTCIITNDDNVPPSQGGGGGGGGGGGSAAPFAYTITTAPTSQGFISPAGIVSVIPGNSSTLTITADPGFEVANVIIDGVSMGPITSHTFSNVQANHTVSATFQGVAGTSTTNLQPSTGANPGTSTGETTGETTPTNETNSAAPTGDAGPQGGTEEPTTTPVDTNTGTENNPAAAAVSGAGGWSAFLGWLAANWPWLLILVIILALLYWWWRSNQTTPAAK